MLTDRYHHCMTASRRSRVPRAGWDFPPVCRCAASVLRPCMSASRMFSSSLQYSPYFTITLNFARARSRSEMRASSHFSHLIATFLPLLIYTPFCEGFPLSRRPFMSYQPSASRSNSPVLVSSVPMAVVSPFEPTSLTVMLCGSSSASAAPRVSARALLGVSLHNR